MADAAQSQQKTAGGLKKTAFWAALLLLAAFGGPISMIRFGEVWKQAKIRAGLGLDDPVAITSNVSSLTPTEVTAYYPDSNPAVASIAAAPLPQMTEAIRFDVAPAWVLQRWPRVSTDLAQLHLHGYRVPLVTGSDATDLAGALTYYFDASQQVRRITFRGTTGDPRQLIGMITSQYGYVRRPNNEPSRLVYEGMQSGGKPSGMVVIQAAPVVKNNLPNSRFSIDLVMDRP